MNGPFIGMLTLQQLAGKASGSSSKCSFPQPGKALGDRKQPDCLRVYPDQTLLRSLRSSPDISIDPSRRVRRGIVAQLMKTADKIFLTEKLCTVLLFVLTSDDAATILLDDLFQKYLFTIVLDTNFYDVRPGNSSEDGSHVDPIAVVGIRSSRVHNWGYLNMTLPILGSTAPCATPVRVLRQHGQ